MLPPGWAAPGSGWLAGVRPALLGLVAGRLVDPGVLPVFEPVVPPAPAPGAVPEPEPVAPAGPPMVPGSDPGAPLAPAPRFERVRSLGVPLRFESVAPGLPLRSLGVAPPWSRIGLGCCPGWVAEPGGVPVPSRGAVPRVIGGWGLLRKDGGRERRGDRRCDHQVGKAFHVISPSEG